MAIPFLACMALVASLYNLPPRVLPSIQKVEGGLLGTIHANADGSKDLGVMQVNTIWIASLAHYTKRDPKEIKARLVSDACFNISAAGAILRAYLNEESGDLMRAIGDYHSHTAPLNIAYQRQVVASAESLFGERPISPTLR